MWWVKKTDLSFRLLENYFSPWKPQSAVQSVIIFAFFTLAFSIIIIISLGPIIMTHDNENSEDEITFENFRGLGLGNLPLRPSQPSRDLKFSSSKFWHFWQFFEGQHDTRTTVYSSVGGRYIRIILYLK